MNTTKTPILICAAGGIGTGPGVPVGAPAFALLKIVLRLLGVNPYGGCVVRRLVVAAVAPDLRKYLAKK
jgi:ABC-type glucose/galactose transport system permease subunit